MKLKTLNRKLNIIIPIIFLIITVLIALFISNYSLKGETFAKSRVLEMVSYANTNDPADVYPYLTKELREMCTKEQFVENWNDERTYPYLIPFYVFYREISLDDKKETGSVKFERAARLPGQFESYGVVYEDGNYYFDAFHNIADGSYVEIFDRLK